MLAPQCGGILITLPRWSSRFSRCMTSISLIAGDKLMELDHHMYNVCMTSFCWPKSQKKIISTKEQMVKMVKFIYSEKATQILRNLHLFFGLALVPVKKRWRFRKNLVAFSEYMNFKRTFSNQVRKPKVSGNKYLCPHMFRQAWWPVH